MIFFIIVCVITITNYNIYETLTKYMNKNLIPWNLIVTHDKYKSSKINDKLANNDFRVFQEDVWYNKMEVFVGIVSISDGSRLFKKIHNGVSMNTKSWFCDD